MRRHDQSDWHHVPSKSSGCFRSWLAVFIVAASVNLSLPLLPGAFTAVGRDASPDSGVIRVAGTVTIDGAQGGSGQTIFSGSQVVTAEGAESIIDLGKLTRLRLSSATDLSLDFSQSRITSTLRKGTVRAFIPAGLLVSIHTAGGELVTDPALATEFTIQVTDQNTQIAVKSGYAELRHENMLETIRAGEVFGTTGKTQESQDDDAGLSTKEKVGIFAAIGGVAALLLIVFKGRDEEEPVFGGCVIILSGPTSGMCP